MNKPLVKKENLEKILALLPHLMKEAGNEWFKAEVTKLVLENKNPSTLEKGTLHLFSENEGQYIMINPEVLLIDYDDIQDERVRTKLKADCFEMARHRLGRVNHEPDFKEFCRYAQLQIENMINYYFASTSLDIVDIKNKIKKYYDSKRINDHGIEIPGSYDMAKDSATQIGEIHFKYKSRAFINEKSLSKYSFVISKINASRNKLSHRSTFTELDEDRVLDEYQLRKGVINPKNLKGVPFQIQVTVFEKEQNWNEVFDCLLVVKKSI